MIFHESQNTEFKTAWHDEHLKWICDFTRLMEDIPNKIRNTMGMISERIRKDFGNELAKAFEIINQHPEWSTEQIAEALGKSLITIENYLARLKKAGFIQRKGPKLGGHWEEVDG